MSYDVRITRQQHWADKNDAKKVSEDEWRAVIEADAQMRLEGVAAVVTPSGDELVYLNPPLALWLEHPNGQRVTFDFRRGNIVLKNPDEATLTKMKELALRLSARVQGEEGELYDWKEDDGEDVLRAI